MRISMSTRHSGTAIPGGAPDTRPSLRLMFLLPALLYVGLARVVSPAAVSTTTLPPSSSSLPPEIASKVHNVPITTEHGIELYQHWIDQALSSLFSAVANKRLKTVPKNVQNEFGACSKDAKTVPLHARCVSKLLKNEFTGKDYDDYEDERMSNSSKTELYSTTIARNLIKEHGHKFQPQLKQHQKEQKKKQQRKTSARLQKFAAPAEERTHGQKSQRRAQKNQKNWVGGFRVVDDAPPAGPGSARLEKLRKLESIVRRAKRESVFGAEGGGRRSVVSRDQYTLKTATGGLTPFGGVAKLLMKTVLNAKNKTNAQSKPWQHVIQGIREVQKKRREYKKHLEEDSLENMDQFAFRGLKQRGFVGDDLEKAIEDPEMLKTFLAKKRKESANDPSAKLMHLLREGFKVGYALSGKNSSDVEDKTMKLISPRFLSVVPEDEDEKNSTLDFLSPSLFSLHNEGSGVENLTSLPNLINGFSNKDQQEWMNFIIEAADVQEQLDRFEDEITGKKNKTITVADREEYERESRGKDGTPLYFTKENVTAFGDIEVQKINVFERLEKTYSKDQIKEMSDVGYTVMDKKQLKMVYGPGSPYADQATYERLSRVNRARYDSLIMSDIERVAQMQSFKVKELNTTGFTRMTPSQLRGFYGAGSPYANNATLQKFLAMNDSTFEAGLREDIGRLSQLRDFHVRQKDFVLSPITFTWIVLAPELASQPIVLSPIIFSPLVLSPSLLGPVILSPWLFVPVILSPRVLSPLIISPFAISPVVLSPIVLHPVILSPGVLDPIVLTPFVLSPAILSPLALSPLILSPLVLSPFILSPAVLSPLILSPFVLSPIIASPQAISALVLSPYAASPVIWSPLIAFSVVLSPSWLS